MVPKNKQGGHDAADHRQHTQWLATACSHFSRSPCPPRTGAPPAPESTPMLPVAIITTIIGSNLTAHAVDIATTNKAPRAATCTIAGALLLATLLTTLTLTI